LQKNTVTWHAAHAAQTQRRGLAARQGSRSSMPTGFGAGSQRNYRWTGGDTPAARHEKHLGSGKKQAYRNRRLRAVRRRSRWERQGNPAWSSSLRHRPSTALIAPRGPSGARLPAPRCGSSSRAEQRGNRKNIDPGGPPDVQKPQLSAPRACPGWGAKNNRHFPRRGRFRRPRGGPLRRRRQRGPPPVRYGTSWINTADSSKGRSENFSWTPERD